MTGIGFIKPIIMNLFIVSYKHYTTRIQYRVNIQLTAPIFSSFCRRTLGKIWSTNILFQQRTKGKSSRSTTQFLFRRIPFFKWSSYLKKGMVVDIVSVLCVRRDDQLVDFVRTFCKFNLPIKLWQVCSLCSSFQTTHHLWFFNLFIWRTVELISPCTKTHTCKKGIELK